MQVATDTIIKAEDLSVFLQQQPAVSNVSLDVSRNQITAIIGPSGCGKSTLLRSFNRMNDLVPTASVSGRVIFEGRNIYDPEVDPTEIRYLIGMVFQRPNPFPKSIYDNVAFGRASTAFAATWENWWSDRWWTPRFGMRSRTA